MVNKTLKAVQRSTNAAYGLNNVVDAVDKESNVTPESTKHTHASSLKVVEEIITALNGMQPFQNQPGRMLRSFPDIPKSPLDKLDINALNKWLTVNKTKLFKNAFAVTDETEDATFVQDEDDEESLSDSENEDEVFIV